MQRRGPSDLAAHSRLSNSLWLAIGYLAPRPCDRWNEHELRGGKWHLQEFHRLRLLWACVETRRQNGLWSHFLGGRFPRAS